MLITDNGSEFTAQSFREYLTQLGIKHHRTTPYHPQSNGKNERFHRTLKAMLAKLVNNRATDWEQKLPDALLRYRITVSSATGHSPYFLMYGRQPRIPLTRCLTAKADSFGNRLDDLAEALRRLVL